MNQTNRIALGLSSSAWPLLQWLKNRSYVDKLALPHGAASNIGSPPEDLLVCSASQVLKDNWYKEGIILVVGAIGAITRLVAPFVKNKEEDPAVIVIDAKGFNFVPLLGGHKAGAEELAIQLAEDFGGNAVCTGDSISQGRLSLDSFGNAWGWKRNTESAAWNRLMKHQAVGGKLRVKQYSGTRLWQGTKAASQALLGLESNSDGDILDLQIGSEATKKACWHPATLWIGMGCERNTSLTLIERSLMFCLDEVGLAQEAIAGLASIDRKSDEPAFLELAERRGWPLRFFSSDHLSEISVPNPSALVANQMGTPSVAEAAALLAAGEQGDLIQEKKVFHSLESESGALTIAISESLEPFAPNRGELHLVGSGPGDLAFLTGDVRSALSRTVVWIGYGMYLDLLEPLRRNDQVRIDGQITREWDRCNQAIQLACQGVRVALISSGDSGVFGMAGLALELLLQRPENQRPKFQVHPGVTSMQMASSLVGAPLMQDFCVVSLSDCLTPWDKIEERLISAIRSDFVIALFNPKSRSRDWQFKYVIDLLLEHRRRSTPVALARQVGRPEQKISLCQLDSIPINQVDMVTVVLVGNSQSFLKDGWFVTPRGYSIS